VLVSRALGYLAAARHGLTEDEMLDVLSADEDVMADFVRRSPRSPKVNRLPVAVWSRLYFDLEPYLTERAADQTTLMAFYHRQVGEVVTEAYLAGDAATPLHRRLAEHFARQPHRLGDPCDGPPNVRKCAELPWQQMRGEWWDGIEATLTDLLFIEAKCEAGMTYDLVADHNGAGRAPGEAREKIEPFGRFVRANAHVFVHDEEWLIQRAYNSAASGPVPERAEALLYDPARPRRPWLRRRNRPEATLDACLMTLEGHAHRVRAVALTPDGRRAVTGGEDETAKVWDLETGACLLTLEGHTHRVWAVAVTPDGRRAVTASNDRTAKAWDLSTGMCLRTLEGHSGNVEAVAVTPDGRRAVTRSLDRTIGLWDLETGQEVACLIGEGPMRGCAVGPNGAIVAGDEAGNVYLLELVE